MYYKNILFNEEMEFLSTANNDFRISLNSAVLSLGDLTTAMLVPMDLLGIDRTIEPDLGAFQRTSEE
jgi:hypothetical protein